MTTPNPTPATTAATSPPPPTSQGLTATCACQHLTLSLPPSPLICHCCHCTHCQRETGSTFALNALYPTTLTPVTLLDPSHPPLMIPTATRSGKPQIIARCPKCHVAVWSHYAGAG